MRREDGKIELTEEQLRAAYSIMLFVGIILGASMVAFLEWLKWGK